MSLNKLLELLTTENQVEEMAKLAEAFREPVNVILNAALSYGPEIKKLYGSLILGISDIHADCFDHLVNNRGFSREEALKLIISQKSFISEYANKMSAKMKKE